MTDKRAQLLAVIEQDIAQDCADYRDLQVLMQGLYELLLARDSARISQSNQRIEALLEAVQQRADRRVKVLQAFSLSADSVGVARLLSAYPSARAEQVQRNWQQLGELAVQCRQQNEQNGQLLAMHNDILMQLLAAEQDQVGVYGQSSY